MDIKDFILIAGGLLIAAVIAHGFWIAWRSKMEPLRLDIVPDLLSGEDLTLRESELARFKGELPNGGSRVIDRWRGDQPDAAAGPSGELNPSQPDLLDESQVPVLLEPNLEANRADKAPAPPSANQLGLGQELSRENDPLPATLAGPAASKPARSDMDSDNTAKRASRVAAERELFGVRMDTGRARDEGNTDNNIDSTLDGNKVAAAEPQSAKTVDSSRQRTTRSVRRRGRSDPRRQGEPDLFAKAAADPMPESQRPQPGTMDAEQVATKSASRRHNSAGRSTRPQQDAERPPVAQTRVAEVELPGAPIVSDPSVPPANEVIPTEASGVAEDETRQALADAAAKYSEPKSEGQSRTPLRPTRPPEPSKAPERRYKSRHLTPKTAPKSAPDRTPTAEVEAAEIAADIRATNRQPIEPVASIDAPVETPATPEPAARENKPADVGGDLIVIHLLAPKGTNYRGPQLVESLRARGLKFGAMGIFHRTDPMTKANAYSVVNMVEPGRFDLSALDTFASPGLTFFMQLPGAQEPVEALADMVDVARSLAQDLGGDVKDEHMSVLTGQTVAHLRQVISDHARRRLSQRA